jgi:hypothetical protein
MNIIDRKYLKIDKMVSFDILKESETDKYLWKLEEISENTYKITNKSNNKILSFFEDTQHQIEYFNFNEEEVIEEKSPEKKEVFVYSHETDPYLINNDFCIPAPPIYIPDDSETLPPPPPPDGGDGPPPPLTPYYDPEPLNIFKIIKIEKKIKTDFKREFNNKDTSDIKIIYKNNETMYLHKLVLKEYFDYFKNLDDVKEIQLGKEFDVFKNENILQSFRNMYDFELPNLQDIKIEDQ